MHPLVQGNVEIPGDIEETRVRATYQDVHTGQASLVIKHAVDRTVVAGVDSILCHGVTTWESGGIRNPCDVVLALD